MFLHKNPLFIPIKSGKQTNKKHPQNKTEPLSCPKVMATITPKMPTMLQIHTTQLKSHSTQLLNAHMHGSPHCPLKPLPLFQAINERLVLHPTGHSYM